MPLKVGFNGRPEAPREAPDGDAVDFYEVCEGRYLLAGSYTKTYTRLNTMEHSNEAGRHAVNAILDALYDDQRRFRDFISHSYRGSQRLRGDYCQIWDMEEYEFEDLMPLRRIDEKLCDEGLPHFVEILALEEMLERWTPDEDGVGPAEQAMAFIEAMRGDLENAFGVGIDLRAMLARGPEALRAMIDKILERIMAQGV